MGVRGSSGVVMQTDPADGGVSLERVLLVDAALDERQRYALALRSQGYDVRESGDGEEALLETRRAAPDVIVADAVLPKVDCLQLLAALRAEAATRETPFIMLTGYDQPLHVITDARSAGASELREGEDHPSTIDPGTSHRGDGPGARDHRRADDLPDLRLPAAANGRGPGLGRSYLFPAMRDGLRLVVLRRACPAAAQAHLTARRTKNR